MLIRTALAAIGLLALSSAAGAGVSFDNCVRKLCTTTLQDACWIRAGASLCDRQNDLCFSLPDAASAQVERKVGHRWYARTNYGKGWVSDRMMMISGDKCPSLPTGGS